jgi:Domain of unknown function (DUF397)
MAATDDQDLSRAAWRKSSYSNNGGSCVEVAAVWRTSSHSGNGGSCVEVAHALVWQKSTHSNDGGNCVEVAGTGPAVAVRDSKNPDGPTLAFTPAQWHTFTTRLTAVPLP